MSEINKDRLTEIATMALHKLLEIDPDMAQRFMLEEIEMDMDEVSFFEVGRRRTATDIDWDSGNDTDLPSEVEIPYDVYDDDIDDYLSERFDYTVNNYVIEEDDE